jgi:hypothetical protein
MFDVARCLALETSVSKTVESVAEDVAADSSALRQNVARLATAMSGLMRNIATSDNQKTRFSLYLGRFRAVQNYCTSVKKSGTEEAAIRAESLRLAGNAVFGAAPGARSVLSLGG